MALPANLEEYLKRIFLRLPEEYRAFYPAFEKFSEYLIEIYRSLSKKYGESATTEIIMAFFEENQNWLTPPDTLLHEIEEYARKKQQKEKPESNEPPHGTVTGHISVEIGGKKVSMPFRFGKQKAGVTTKIYWVRIRKEDAETELPAKSYEEAMDMIEFAHSQGWHAEIVREENL